MEQFVCTELLENFLYLSISTAREVGELRNDLETTTVT